jgi:hypothetical protein
MNDVRLGLDCSSLKYSRSVESIFGSHEFIQHGVRLLDARTTFMYFAAGITPAMSAKIVGGGSQYAAATFDSKGHYLDGSKTYRLHLPPNIPVNNFWSLIPYDTQTRSCRLISATRR